MSRKRKQKRNKYTRVTQRDTPNIPVIIGATGIVTKSFRQNFGNYTRKTFDRFTIKDSHTGNITHHTESTAV